jgi:serine/threonine-protein kinase
MEGELPFDQTLRAKQELHTLPDLPALTVGDDAGAELRPGELLGQGGMGVVRVARQHALEREVAVKQLRPGSGQERALALIHEARTMGALEHPNIIPVHALGADPDGSPILVMKRVEGVSWRTLIREPDHAAWRGAAQWSPDPVVRHVDILIEVCKAMQFAHSRGVIHRDLKPDNVMIGPFGEVYVVDWGVACRPADREPGLHPLVGTPAYMAPEMADLEGKHDERTDVFLLGGCLHEALTGETPNHGATLREVLEAAAAPAPRRYPAAVPAELVTICHQAMAADPARRFADVATLRAALADHVRHRGSARLAGDAARLVEQGLPREAHFAYRQALREWPENPEARAGLIELLRTDVAARIDHDDHDGAAESLAELAALDARAVPPELARRAERARADWQALQARARAVDPRIGRPARVTMIIGMVLVSAAGSVLQWERVGSRWVDDLPALLFFIAMPVVVGMAVIMFAARRALFQNALSRRIALFELVGGVAVLVNRGNGWVDDADLAAILATDCLIFAINSACIGLFVRPQILPLSLPWLAVALATPQLPHLAGELFTAGTLLCGVFMMVFVRWDRPLEEAMPRS